MFKAYDDKTLVIMTLSGEQRAYEELVKRYQSRVLASAGSVLKSVYLAEDAAQETFLKVYRKMESFRGESSEKTWIMKIAMHTCYDMNHSGWFRFMNRRVTPDMLPEPAPSPQAESDGELADAVTRLPRKLREVILLYYYQGLNVNEIAEALGISHSSVSCRMKRGREKLKEWLEGSELDEPDDLTDRIRRIH